MPCIHRHFLGLGLFFIVLSPVRAEEEKILDKTKDEWLTIIANDEKPRMRKAAALALGIYGPGKKDVLPALIKALATDKDEAVRLQVVTVMGQLDPKKDLRDVLPTLADVLKEDKSPAVKAASARLIGQLGENALPALATLVASLKDADAAVRAAAVETIGRIGPEAKSAITEMLPLLKDPDSIVRLATVYAYGRLGPEASFIVPDLLQVLEKDGSEEVRKEVAHTLTQIGASSAKFVLPCLIKQLKEEKSPEVRRQLAITLGKMTNLKSAIVEIFDLLKNEKDRTVRLYVARSIPTALSGGLRDHVKEYAQWLAKEPDGDVRVALVQELGALGPAAAEALGVLMSAENDVVLQVREAAKDAVQQVKGTPKKEPKK